MDSGMGKLQNQSGISRQQAVQPVMLAFWCRMGFSEEQAFEIHNTVWMGRETERLDFHPRFRIDENILCSCKTIFC